jgi:hypothetical protein
MPMRLVYLGTHTHLGTSAHLILAYYIWEPRANVNFSYIIVLGTRCDHGDFHKGCQEDRSGFLSLGFRSL